MHLPFWLLLPFLPAAFWPVTLPVLIVLIVLAIRLRGRYRRVSIAGAAAIVVPPVLGFGFLMGLEIQGRAAQRAEHARTHSVLAADTTMDGIALTAGTEIAWSDPAHTSWNGATPPQPIPFHGLQVRSLTRARDGWFLELAEPSRVGGWPCSAYAVVVTGQGGLASCSLAEAMTWQGWVLPRQTRVEMQPAEGTIEVNAPSGEAVVGQEIGRTLPSSVTLNDDGSLAGAYYRRDAPLLAAGVPLWGNLVWRYDPATRGQGRSRTALAITGRTKAEAPSGTEAADEQTVTVQLPGGAVTRESPKPG